MTSNKVYLFSFQDAARGYAAAAERLLGDDHFLDNTPTVWPVFTCNLFQSLELSIKAAGIDSGLFTYDESRKGNHGIQKLAKLATDRLGGEESDLVTAMTCMCSSDVRAKKVISQMIFGTAFEPTRKSYISRNLAYGEVSKGDFQVLEPIREWVDAVKHTAVQLPETVEVLTQWRNSSSPSKHFAIWFNHGPVSTSEGQI